MKKSLASMSATWQLTAAMKIAEWKEKNRRTLKTLYLDFLHETGENKKTYSFAKFQKGLFRYCK